ncbi:glycoside hydrolase family 2 [Sphingomonas yunnanensis]|uniref:glycoside hydrolase family 2 protein n=1 Tax=Sphingomonas yunnanensis TaxID=310400 RepID=UPI001CA7B110|nr:sugar-binding domain-containing protein [Sphingomonas yunnanensis]MBY9064809.1 glycoside hydrolase family 2 [Sphingomonas yunnanensis]
MSKLAIIVAALAGAATSPIAAAQTAPATPAGTIYTSDLVTRWGRAVTPDNAWRGYPRPQMKRTKWLNLNGQWDYAVRPKAAPQPAQMDGKILVPFAVESRLSGVARSVTPDDRLWYKRRFAVPADWQGQRVLLHFGAVDYEASIMVNGSLVGTHRGGSDAFSLDVTDYLKSGDNELVVQVTDPTSTGAQPRGKQVLKPNSIWYTPVTGIWQTVWLEPVPALHVEDMKITPDIDRGTLSVDVALNRSAADDDAVRITASQKGRTVATALVRGNRPATLAITDAHLWSPDDPFLYDLKVELVKVRSPYTGPDNSPHRERGDTILTAHEAALYRSAAVQGGARDTVDGYFAMRKSSIGAGKVPGQPVMMLNNKPLFQNGTLDQGWWPDGLLTPPSEEAIRFEIGYLKSSGFNMLRKHIKVEPAQYYYEADRMGILIWQDMPSGEEDESLDQFVRPSSQGEALMPQETTNEFEYELTRMISDLRNHPSIVTWVVNNEGWGQYASTRLAKMVHELDPSRLVNKVSGWLDTGDAGSDLYDIHTYENVPKAPTHQTHRAIVIGEFGGIGLPVPGHLWFPARKNWGYQTAKDKADYQARYQRKYDEVIRQARDLGLSAAVYTQTTDVEGEINGLLTYDRAESKLPPATFARIHAPLHAAEPGSGQ